MAAHFSLINTQKIVIDKSRTTITLSTKTISGHTHYFDLTRNQFFALDDAITLMKYDWRQTSFPLGHNIWLRCSSNRSNSHDAVIYDATRYEQPYFRFINFEMYKRRVHQRVMSFLRLQHNTTGSRRRPCPVAVKRRRQETEDEGEDEDEDERSHGDESRIAANGVACYQRPLSIAMRPMPGPTTTTSGATHGASIHWSTDDAIVPASGQASPVLPQWNDTSAGRQNDCMAFSAPTCHDSGPFEKIQFSESSDDDAERHSSDAMVCE